MFKNDDRVAVTCIYCNYKEQTEQTVSNQITSLLKQLVQCTTSDFENLTSLYTRYQNLDSRPSLTEFLKSLESEIGKYRKFYIVVDALDECREDGATRAKLVKALRSLTGNVNLLFTSRNLPSLVREFSGAECLSIRATDEDVERYIASRIELGPRHVKRLQDTIITTIVESAQGM